MSKTPHPLRHTLTTEVLEELIDAYATMRRYTQYLRVHGKKNKNCTIKEHCRRWASARYIDAVHYRNRSYYRNKPRPLSVQYTQNEARHKAAKLVLKYAKFKHILSKEDQVTLVLCGLDYSDFESATLPAL